MSTTASSAGAWAALIEMLSPVVPMAVGALLTLIITRLGTRDSARIEKQKDIDLRLWELRRVGYSVVLETLREVSKHADRLNEGYNGPMANPIGFDDTDRCRECWKRSSEAWAECRAEFGKNQLVFAQPFVSAFQHLESSLPHEYVALTPPEEAEALAKCFGDAQVTLRRIALSEFGLNSEEDFVNSRTEPE